MVIIINHLGSTLALAGVGGGEGIVEAGGGEARVGDELLGSKALQILNRVIYRDQVGEVFAAEGVHAGLRERPARRLPPPLGDQGTPYDLREPTLPTTFHLLDRGEAWAEAERGRKDVIFFDAEKNEGPRGGPGGVIPMTHFIRPIVTGRI